MKDYRVSGVLVSDPKYMSGVVERDSGKDYNWELLELLLDIGDDVVYPITCFGSLCRTCMDMKLERGDKVEVVVSLESRGGRKLDDDGNKRYFLSLKASVVEYVGKEKGGDLPGDIEGAGHIGDDVPDIESEESDDLPF